MEELGRRLTDLSWAGGIIDGEGCILINRGVMLDVQATSKSMINKLFTVLGGRRSVEKRLTVKGRTVFRWTLHAAKAVAVLRLLLPYLIEKRAQALLASSYYNYPARSAMRKSIKNRIHALKRTS